MRTVQLFVVSLLALFSLHGSAHAADIAFFPVESATVTPTDASAIGELLAQSYASVSGQAVLAPSRITVDERPYSELAASLSVPEYVRTDAVQVGARVVIHSVRYRADGTAIYQVKLTAERIEDTISVSDRIAKSLYHRVDDELVRTRHNVTLAEARPETRRWSEKIFGFKTGVHIPFGKDADFSPSIGLAFDVRLEMDRFFVEFGGGFLIPTDPVDDSYCYDNCEDFEVSNQGSVGGLTGEIGGSYFLTDGNIAPYIGAGLLPRIILTGNGDDIAQMAPYVQLGVTIPRDSSTRFYADMRLAQSIVSQTLDNGQDVYPTELSLQAGIGW